jgi:hypothetical protein
VCVFVCVCLCMCVCVYVCVCVCVCVCVWLKTELVINSLSHSTWLPTTPLSPPSPLLWHRAIDFVFSLWLVIVICVLQDRVAMVTFSDQARLAFGFSTGSDLRSVLAQVSNAPTSPGATNISAALMAAQTMVRHFDTLTADNGEALWLTADHVAKLWHIDSRPWWDTWTLWQYQTMMRHFGTRSWGDTCTFWQQTMGRDFDSRQCRDTLTAEQTMVRHFDTLTIS